jgi:membrane-bound lytic murein transglycosylase D
VRRTGYADFWELYRRNVLPRETRNYVPIIVAVTIMAKNRSQYGLDGITPDAPQNYDAVEIDYPVDLRLVAECVDVSVDTLQELNPGLLRMTTPKDSPFELRLPAGTKEKYSAAVAAIPEEMRVWWRYHKIETGETIANLARTYHTSAEAITEANGLAEDELVAGTKVIIPIAPGKIVPGETGDVYSKQAVRYRVRKGDTVASVAEDFGVPAEKVRTWNRLRGNALRRGRTLRIYPPLTANSREAKARPRGKSKAAGTVQQAKKGRILRHKVRKGETLSSIATTYNTSVETLKRDNRRHSAGLRPGDVLVVRAHQ